MISEAAQQLARDPGHALALLDEHELRFPRELLCEERESLRIDALSALGREQAARETAAKFIQRFPSSAHVPRLEHMLSLPEAAAHRSPQPDRTPTE